MSMNQSSCSPILARFKPLKRLKVVGKCGQWEGINHVCRSCMEWQSVRHGCWNSLEVEMVPYRTLVLSSLARMSISEA